MAPVSSALATALLLLSGGAAAADAAAAKGSITRIQEVRSLGEAALKTTPGASLRGVVLQTWPAKSNFVMQDEEDAIFVSLRDSAGGPLPLPSGLVKGSFVEVTGVAAAGRFAPVCLVQRTAAIHLLGNAPLPAPLPLTAETAASGLLDCRRVTLEGVVRRLRTVTWLPLKTVQMDVLTGGTRVTVFLEEASPAWKELVDARIRVTGICSGIWNKEGQIIAPSLLEVTREEVTVLRPAPTNPFAQPVLSVADILRFRKTGEPGHRIHIVGTVLHASADGRVFVMDEGRTVCVESAGPSGVAAGDRVDAVGFPSMRARSPMLEDAMILVRSHQAPLPRPTPRVASDILTQSKDYELIQLTAMLLESQRTNEELALLLKNEGQVFKAVIEGPGHGGVLGQLQPGAELALTGMVLFSFPSPSKQQFLPDGYSLLLRSPADVRVLRQPSWWTSRRLLWILSGALTLVIGALAWAGMLRHRVKRQTILIANGVKRTATLEERTRLAREFHDSLEQELTGLALQIETAHATLSRAPEQTGPVLSLLNRLARRCVEEARLAVLDLRSSALAARDLPAAIRAAVTGAFEGHPATVQFTLGEIRPPLPPRIEHALLRIAQEAATNAVRHAHATCFEVELRQENGFVALLLHDDGCGFEPDSSPAVGQFGLLGMRERVEKCGGRLTLHSEPGSGTRINVRVPLNPSPA